MAHTLSEESSLSLYDKGHRTFRSSFDSHSMKLPILDFDKILEQKNSKKMIGAINPQVLYFSLKNKGLDDSLDVLPLISKEQFIKIFDYDVWQHDEISTEKVFSWLNLYKKIEVKQMLTRYQELDEEYQIATLAPYVKAYTEEEYEKMGEAQQDSLYAFPGNEIYFSVGGLDKKTHESVVDFFEIAGEHDIEYAASLLSHLTYMPPRESSFAMSQFRKARLEEDGFVSFEESRSFFQALNTKAFKAKLDSLPEASCQHKQTDLVLQDDSKSFLDQVLCYSKEHYPEEAEKVQKSFLLLVNALTTAVGVESDSLSDIKHLLKITHGTVSFSLEVLAHKNISYGAYLLSKECYLKDLFRFAVSYLNDIKRDFLKKLATHQVIDAKKYLSDLDTFKYGALLDRVDKNLLGVFGLERTEVLKAFLSRFSFYPESVAHKVSDQSIHSLFFSVVSSCSHVTIIKSHLDLYLQQISLVKKACLTFKFNSTMDLDDVIKGALASYLVGGDFIFTDSHENYKKELKSNKMSSLSQRLDDFLAGLSNSGNQEQLELYIKSQFDLLLL